MSLSNSSPLHVIRTNREVGPSKSMTFDVRTFEPTETPTLVPLNPRTVAGVPIKLFVAYPFDPDKKLKENTLFPAILFEKIRVLFCELNVT